VSHDREARIRIRAYRIWQELRCPDGHAVEHWVEAERQLYREEDSRFSEDETGSDASKSAARKSEHQDDLAARRLGAAKAASESSKG
jgi:hypothetical protein